MFSESTKLLFSFGDFQVSKLGVEDKHHIFNIECRLFLSITQFEIDWCDVGIDVLMTQVNLLEKLGLIDQSLS